MTNLIIGCGYLGRVVARLWREEGARVLATTRRPEGADELRALGLEPVVCDVLAPAGMRDLPPVDAVLYAVGFDRTAGRSMREVYVDGLARVLDHLPAAGRFVYVSSSSVYGQTNGEWVDEDSPTEPQEDAGRIVLDAETVLRARRPAAMVLRFSGIYGPGRLLRRATIEKAEPIVGDADKWLNLIHVEDGARAVLAAASRGTPGRVYNVCDDTPVRRREFYHHLASLLGAPEPVFVAPPPDRPTLPHEKGNRRIRNRRMREELKVQLEYPGFKEGLRASVYVP